MQQFIHDFAPVIGALVAIGFLHWSFASKK